MIKEGFKLGLDQNTCRVIHIDQVEEGFDQAICPDCCSTLIASNRNRETRRKDTYFRHKAESNCQGETLIHLWAKQVLADHKRVLGAEYKAIGKAKDLSRKYHTVELKQSPEWLGFSDPELEKRLEDGENHRTPDVMGRYEDTGQNLSLEVYVNSAVDDRKSLFFQSMGMDCLEIDLSGMPIELLSSPKGFERFVISEAPRKWIFCSRYIELENEAQRQAEDKATKQSEIVDERRGRKRTAKAQWRETHKEFIRLVEAYIEPENQKKAEDVYEAHLSKSGALSNRYKVWFDRQFGGIPEVINIPLKGELGFNCHRSVWQWEIYQRAALYSHHRSTVGVNKPFKKTRANRGYEEANKMLAWYDYAPKWSPEELYQSIKELVPQNRISIEAETIAGEPLNTEREKPVPLSGLKVKEWRELPKPVCTIRRYIKELLKQDILEVFSGDTYVVPQNARLPIVYDVSNLKV